MNAWDLLDQKERNAHTVDLASRLEKLLENKIKVDMEAIDLCLGEFDGKWPLMPSLFRELISHPSDKVKLLARDLLDRMSEVENPPLTLSRLLAHACSQMSWDVVPDLLDRGATLDLVSAADRKTALGMVSMSMGNGAWPCPDRLDKSLLVDPEEGRKRMRVFSLLMVAAPFSQEDVVARLDVLDKMVRLLEMPPTEKMISLMTYALSSCAREEDKDAGMEDVAGLETINRPVLDFMARQGWLSTVSLEKSFLDMAQAGTLVPDLRTRIMACVSQSMSRALDASTGPLDPVNRRPQRPVSRL